MAGTIPGASLVPGLASDVFVIELSQNMINFLGLILISFKYLCLTYGTHQVVSFLFNAFVEAIKNINDKESVIDVDSRLVNSRSVKRIMTIVGGINA